MDDAIIQAMDRMREDFTRRSSDTDTAFNNGFRALRTDMQDGNKTITLQLMDIARKMDEHQREDAEVDRRVTVIEAERKTEALLLESQSQEAESRMRRRSSTFGVLAAAGVSIGLKVAEWVFRR